MKTPSDKAIVRELLVLSFLSLFFELLIIRWMSADMRAFTIFRTFPLIACFVGLGVGFALRQDKSYSLFLPATLLFVVVMEVCNYVGICFWGFPSFGNFQWQNLVGLVLEPGWSYLGGFALIVVLLLMGPFAMNVAIGSRLGVLFNQLPALRAYSYNVFGALVGSIALPILSFFGCPPWVELIAGSAAIAYLQRQQVSANQNRTNIVLLLVLIPLLLFVPDEHSKPGIPSLLDAQTQRFVLWSPYQRLDLAAFYETPILNGATAPGGNTSNNPSQKAATVTQSNEPDHHSFLGLEIGVNRAFYQYFFSNYAFTASRLAKSGLLQNIEQEYAMPFVLNKPNSALIVGAGAGQNVSSALAAGLTDIDAVEIDPVILNIGRKYNPDYQSPRVHLICDDARHYFAHCQKHYDVIDFSTLDSHAVAGLGSSVRVDMYIYSKESIQRALSLLTDKGTLVCSFAAVAPWMKDRLYATFKEAAGYPPLCLQGKFLSMLYFLGNPVKDGSLASNPALTDHYGRPSVSDEHQRILTDDWPYLYVRTDVIDYPYLLVVAEIILLSVFGARRFLFSNRDLLNWQMFFLGAAFMLLELHAIIFLSLLYGATWITSAIVISSILLMIAGANALVLKYESLFSSHPLISYVALIASVLVNYAVPGEQMLSMGAIGHVIATLMAVLPLAFAALVFANSFRKAQNISGALAFNLFGAVIGGLLEYVSIYTGIRSLLIVSLALYLGSLLCCLSRKENSGA